MDTLLGILDPLGIIAFALSGAILAIRKKMDVFGVCVIALLPAVGGGTLRDLVLDVPVFWVQDTLPIWLAVGTAISAFYLPRWIEETKMLMRWADAIGLSVFAVLGTAKTYAVTGNALVAMMMGVATAIAGGIIRDTICNVVPLVLRQEIYALAAIAGAATWLGLTYVDVTPSTAQWIAIAVTFAVRVGAMLRGWTPATSQ